MTKKLKILNDSALTLCFFGVLITGIMLHLKKHGLIIEPRPVLKAVHYGIGFGMTLFAAVHVAVYYKLLAPLKKKYRFTVVNCWVLILTLSAVVITGLVKLFSPVRIPHLGHGIIGSGLSWQSLL